MHGNSVRAYKLVNGKEHKYVTFRWVSKQSVYNTTVQKATNIREKGFPHAAASLCDAVSGGDHSSWEPAAQTMGSYEPSSFQSNSLDATNKWPKDKFPFRPVELFVLTGLPEILCMGFEQSAFDSENFLSSTIEPNEDRLL